MRFPIAIHKDTDSDWGVTVPDLPGCFSAGETMEQALENAREAILCHVEGLLADGDPVPTPQSVDHHRSTADLADAVWAMVAVDLSEVAGKPTRINVSMPQRVLSQVDAYARQRGESRSGLLTTAALEYISVHSNEA